MAEKRISRTGKSEQSGKPLFLIRNESSTDVYVQFLLLKNNYI